MSKDSQKNANDIILRPHTYDGIQEYDQRLPNWWLNTLYGAIIFSFVYWFYYYQSKNGLDDITVLENEMAAIEQTRLENSFDVTDDTIFLEMSENANVVANGEIIYKQNCMACHGANLEGGVGFALNDAEWVHGDKPTQIYTTVEQGIPAKGMQAWGPLLGQKKIAEVVAYILNHNKNTK